MEGFILMRALQLGNMGYHHKCWNIPPPWGRRAIARARHTVAHREELIKWVGHWSQLSRHSSSNMSAERLGSWD